MNYFPEVFLCYNNKQVYSLKDNEEFYNSAKISLNTKSIQATNGFSFRVCDILASNACLVTEKCDDLNILFPKVGIPTFTSPAEAREQCKRLLENENLRIEIVNAAHETIDKNFRFKQVLDNLEDITNMCMHSSTFGTLELFSDEFGVTQLQKEQSSKISSIKKFYYNSLGKHTGYDPYHIFETRKINIGKIPICKVLKTKPNRKEGLLLFYSP